MHMELRRGGGKPLPRQISETLAQRITSGLLAPGTQLPSVRRLAAELAVSQVTVSKAYEELEKRGLLDCRQGKGCYVANRQLRTPDEGKSWADEYGDYLPRAQLWHNFDSSAVHYSFHVAAIHSSLLPLAPVGAAMAKLVQEQPELMAEYGNFQGDLDLREVMGRHLQVRGMQVTSRDILITSGAQQGIDLVARTFIGPGDAVYMEAPGYTGAIDVFAGRGAEIIPVPVDEEGMRVDILTRLCDRRPPKLIYTNPSFQNPSGVTMSMRKRQRLLELARSYRCLIVEDDPFSDLYFHKPPPPAIKSLDGSGHVVYLKSFSKVLAPGSRIACVAAESGILSRLIAAKSSSDLGSPLLTQKAVLPFIRDEYEPHARMLRSALQRRRDKAIRLLRAYAPSGVTWNTPDGGLNLWLKLPPAADVIRLHGEAEASGISFLHGEVCYAGEAPPGHIRICYAQMWEDEMAEGLRLFLVLLAKHLRSAAE
ncbi:PLP-dependent aminotransferase family protein [Paenibacillus sp. NFR01]|uniref:MocR-like pyridoxine biosynthesis transcription factor PdxR n=1 Tax=Paenibacillus sp. NFR01 TaxID=1566279 RepID=UPI0008C0F441|nr:PLP-dependent aminotransferase family protein [Paenibacillus sp. NFR01]SET65101.1 DNA-binding transcriptional regulator, MocR family, contains an aminotransferase domain [Paenibacillus sp. NFR01]